MSALATILFLIVCALILGSLLGYHDKYPYGRCPRCKRALAEYYPTWIESGVALYPTFMCESCRIKYVRVPEEWLGRSHSLSE